MQALENQSRTNRRWVSVARTGWWIFTGLSIFLFLAAIPLYFDALNEVCRESPCLAMQLTMGRAIVLKLSGISFQLYSRLIIVIQILVFLINLGIGVFIFSRKSTNWLAILVSLMLITSIQADLYRSFLVGYPALRAPTMLLGIVNSALLIVFFYIFPTGSFRPRWTAGLAGLWLVFLIGSSTFPILTMVSPGKPTLLYGLYVTLLIGSSLAVLIYRYNKVLSPIQRQQAKWVVFGLAITWGGEVILQLLRVSLPIFETNAVLLIFWSVLALGWTIILPVSILIAVLSAALLDIDVLIRRTLAYTILTITLLLVYFGSILILQKIFELATGQRSPLVSIISTLAIAAIATPLRRRIQHSLDRVFSRNAYNARQSVQAFNASVREDVDLLEITTQLAGTVQATLQPEFMSLWLCSISEDMDITAKDLIR